MAADYSGVRIFGCDAYVLIPKATWTKLEPTSKKGKFLDMGRRSRAIGSGILSIAHLLSVGKFPSMRFDQ